MEAVFAVLGFTLFYVFCFFFGMGGAASVWYLIFPSIPALMKRIRRADVKTVYDWIECAPINSVGMVSVTANVPYGFIKRRIEMCFYTHYVMPQDVFIAGQCMPGSAERIPPSLAGAIRLHMFPVEFEFPEESQ